MAQSVNAYQFGGPVAVGGKSSPKKSSESSTNSMIGKDGKLGIFWVGNDGRIYTQNNAGKITVGAVANPSTLASANAAFRKVSSPDATPVTSTSSAGGESSIDYAAQAAAQAAAQKAAKVNSVRGEIKNNAQQLQAIYNALFGDLDNLLKSRASKVETQYGDQFAAAAKQYADSLPKIQNSYAAIGAADSTDTADAKDSAKEGFDTTNKTIGKNKHDDLNAIGQYGNEQRARFLADQDSLNRNLGRVDTTDDLDALRSMRNDIESNIGTANTTKATLGTDASAGKALSTLTADNGRYQEAVNALDSILKGSMSGAVKEAAVKSIVDNAGLSDEDKNKINLQYGNVYNETNAQ